MPFLSIPRQLFIWTGLAGDNLWSSARNWNTHAVPGAQDVARFYGSRCSGSACNVTVNANVSVGGIVIDSEYSGVITQSTGRTIAVGSNGWTQNGGTFTGGNSDIVITGGAFALSGGTFSSTSTNLKIVAASGAGYTVFSQSGGTFNAGTGTLYFSIASAGCVNNTHYVIDVNSTLTVNHLRYAGGHPSAANVCYWDLGTGDSITANGNFNVAVDLAAGKIASTGTLNVKGNLTYGTGTNGGTLAVTLNGTGTQNMTQTAGTTLPTGALTIDKSAGSAVALSALTMASTTLEVKTGILDTKSYNLSVNYFYLRAGVTFRQSSGNISWASGKSFDTTSTFEVYGGSSTYNFSSVGLPNFLVNKTGTLTLTGNLSVRNLSISAGTLSSAGYSVTVNGNWSNAGTYTSGTSMVTLTSTNPTITGSNTFYSLKKISAGTITVAAGSTQVITNALTLTGSTWSARLALRSSVPGTAWQIDPQGTRTLGYLDVQDSNNINATAAAADETSLDSGNNTNWTFLPSTPSKTVFLTSVGYTGYLGGVSSAHAKCAARATAAGLSGTFKAWVADGSGNDPASTFNHSSVPYKMVDGTVIANNWTELTSGTLVNAITLDETGAASGGSADRWTGVAANGTALSGGYDDNCWEWWADDTGSFGSFGSPGSVNGAWTDNSPTRRTCDQSLRLICIQQ